MKKLTLKETCIKSILNDIKKMPPIIKQELFKKTRKEIYEDIQLNIYNDLEYYIPNLIEEIVFNKLYEILGIKNTNINCLQLTNSNINPKILDIANISANNIIKKIEPILKNLSFKK